MSTFNEAKAGLKDFISKKCSEQHFMFKKTGSENGEDIFSFTSSRFNTINGRESSPLYSSTLITAPELVGFLQAHNKKSSHGRKINFFYFDGNVYFGNRANDLNNIKKIAVIMDNFAENGIVEKNKAKPRTQKPKLQ